MKSDYYVYFHRRKDNGAVFYVGKGSNRRLYDKSRSKVWKSVVSEAGGFIAEIHKDNLTNKEALKIECQLISNPKENWELVNEPANASIDYNKNWHDLFYYDETSKSCLRWKYSKYPKRIGKEVGSYHQSGSTGYWNVNVGGRMHKIHRIIWVMFNSKLEDDMFVNHVNNDCKDNRLSNLEKCTPMENGNRSKRQNPDNFHKDSYVTEKSVAKIVRGESYTYYSAYVSIKRNGKILTKNFSYNKYGNKEKAWELARVFRDAALNSFDEALSLQFTNQIFEEMYMISKGSETTKSGNINYYYKVTTRKNTKQFAFNKHGGESNALKLAIEYRNLSLKQKDK